MFPLSQEYDLHQRLLLKISLILLLTHLLILYFLYDWSTCPTVNIFDKIQPSIRSIVLTRIYLSPLKNIISLILPSKLY